MECADCHTSFANRSVTHWDVHLPDGSYVTVCTPCFDRRDQARPVEKGPSRSRSPAKSRAKARNP